MKIPPVSLYLSLVLAVFSLRAFALDFDDDFSRTGSFPQSLGGNWQILGGNATISTDGEVAVTGTKLVVPNALVRSENSADGEFSIQATVRINATAGSALAGVAFNIQNTDNYYAFRYSGSGYVQLLRRVAGVEAAETSVSGAFSPVTNRPYRLVVFSRAPGLFDLSITDTVTGAVVWSKTDAVGTAGFADGQAGLYATTTVAAFSDFAIDQTSPIAGDRLSPTAGNRSGVVVGQALDDTAVETGAGLVWQNEYNGTSEMNGFLYGQDAGTGRFAVPDGTKTSANNYMPFVFSNIPKVLTVSADFQAADNKAATGSNWTIGFWQTIDNANLSNIASNDAVTLRFFPAGSNEGKLQIRIYVNGVSSATTSSKSTSFAASDVIRLSLSYDMNTGETFATAYNVTTGTVMATLKSTKPDISDLNHVGFGMTGLLANQTNPGMVDNFLVSAEHKSGQMITDSAFQRGASVLEPTTGDVEGVFQHTTKNGSPVWSLAQWQSHGSIYGATPTTLPSGALKWENAFKSVTLGPPGTGDSDLILEVDSIAEYGGVYRDGTAQDWPALLIQQTISGGGGYGDNSPWLDELSALNVNIDANLRLADNQYTEGYDSAKHAAHFLVYFTIQNRNLASSGYGDYLWFGLALYDDREPLPGLHYQQDIGTQKFIYNVGIAPFTSTGMTVGQWKNIAGDILPYVKDALNKAWELGFLTASTNLADYKVGGMNMGWEVPGLSRVAMQVRNFRLEAAGISFPKNYEFNTDANKEGWKSFSLTDANAGPVGGLWSFTASTNDPKLVGPSVRVDANQFTKVRVRMMNNGNPSSTSKAQLFWKVNGGATFSEALSKTVNVSNDGLFTEYVFDMTDDPDWQGEITQLRLDPIMSGDGHPIAVDYIRFD